MSAPADTRFDETLPMLLYRTLDAVMPAYRSLFAEHGLTEPQWRVLRVVWDARSPSQAALSERTLVSPPSLVSILDRLEAKGLVTRVRSVEDRRAVHIVATAEGRALHERVMPAIDAIHERLRDGVSGAQWDAMAATLAAIADRAGAPAEARRDASRHA